MKLKYIILRLVVGLSLIVGPLAWLTVHPTAQQPSNIPVTTVVTSTSTGAQNNFAPGIVGNTLLRMNNATATSITGFAGGYTGQRLTVVSVGAGQVNFTHQDAASTAANRLTNFATVGTTSLAAGNGVAEFIYDGTTIAWRLIRHDQGAWITPTFAAGDFTAATGNWTVDAGDVVRHGFILRDRTVTEYLELNATTISATPNYLLSKIPNSYAAAARASAVNQYADNGATIAAGASWVQAVAATTIRHYVAGFGAANWSTATDNTQLYVTLTYEVQ